MENADYIAGYLQATANFGVLNAKAGKRPYFSAFVDDASVAQSLVSFFAVGALYRNREKQIFRIVKAAELMAIVVQCDAHPLIGERGHRYALWRRLVLERNGVETLKEADQRNIYNSLLHK